MSRLHAFTAATVILLAGCGSPTDRTATVDVVPPPGMVFVPAGITEIGSATGTPDERPAFSATVPAFFLDKTPVTVADFRQFADSTGYVSQAEEFGDGGALVDGAWVLVPGASWERPLGEDGPSAPDDHPVTQVSWNDANAYCAYMGKRLPTEVEWEHAARGATNNQTRYAWGDELEQDQVHKANTWQGTFPVRNTGEDGYLLTSPVGAFGETSLGLADIGGNVWEWTDDWYRPYGAGYDNFVPTETSERIQRGGSFLCNPSWCHGYRVSARSHSTPETSLFHVGFRCADDVDTTTAAFLDDLQERTFRWFWETTDPETGLVPDRYPRRTFSSIAAIGFGLPTYAIGAERGFVTREEAAERTLTTLRFLYDLPQGPAKAGIGGYKGFFYHFLEYGTGVRYREVELSTIDTALLIAGVLFSREYFDGAGADERAIRAYADSMYQRVEWDWFDTGGEIRPVMGWHPESGFGKAIWKGYNEAMILYILGLGSPTFPLEPATWDAWTSTYEWADFYGYPHVNFEPMFGHQYSHLFVDFRGIQDDYMRAKSAEIGEPFDYFENSRRAVLSQRAYAIDNPEGWRDYSGEIWGLTASDGPSNGTYDFNGELRTFRTYSARGVSAQRTSDDGTIAPTAVGGSVPFAPEETIAAMRAMIERYGSNLWTEYGFRDAFNPSFTYADAEIKPYSAVTDQGWFDHEYLGIDQGPIVIMAENYRTGFVWDVLKKSPYIVTGLRRAGFEGGWLDDTEVTPFTGIAFERQPNP